MDNDSVIFAANNTQQVNKYSKRILTGRILIFILAALCFFIAGFGVMVKRQGVGEKEDAAGVLIFFGSMGIIYLICGIISNRKPFTACMVASALTVIVLALFIDFALMGLQYQPDTEMYINCIAIALILVLAFFIVRSAIYAKKRKKLMLLIY